ncbi:CALCINEURIN BETA SUBUNIT [Encephalitozoon cuniculi GB-M1]|uniref:Calcineurin subunit B n=2 Tax=Encephalitozoon cuniculi TaxID=6035 RepID=Q8SRF8_ENCCU|nr:EF-Hand Ca2+-binding protein [Encephalitozoon cuniculi GB-M1]AGE95138.1 calcineurin beta subunit [Encephalitozoon cuniculi]KMV65544.1 EF-Hand Ca2+-binding protein [Encephalitozoon cuniculi EcunIII-L]UYI26941.1 Ca2+-binding protein [Encephalitozoon cuniculi]CAD26322.1 CALCINEURIN BETA SUBUNIT [Encephalitozoon cuniculi GB-M1]
MGSLSSTMLCEEEIEELKNTTVFDEREIEHLYERFQFLDRESRGYLTYNELNNIPEFQSNPFSHLIMKSIEKMTDYEKMTFPHFLEFLGIFSERNSKRNRIRYLFDIFDLNGDGRLCRNVLIRINKMMGQDGRVEEAENLLNIYDEGGKGYLDISDFTRFYESDPLIDKNMIIDFSKNLKERRQVGFMQVLWPSTYKDEP